MQENRKKKKKRKFGYYLYAVVILVLTFTNITLATLLLTHVQSIEVVGTKHSQKNAIISWIKEDPLTTNSLYTLLKFRTGSYSLPVYLEDVEVKLSSPWKVHVKVSEKPIIGCLIEDNAYIYFDEEGLVLQKSTEYNKEVPLIEGLQVENAKKYEKLKVDNKKVFSCFVDITEEIEKYELVPDRLVWEDDGMNLYFEKIRVQLGKSNFDIKVLQLSALLEKLEGQEGILHLEHYTLDSSISFEKIKEDS